MVARAMFLNVTGAFTVADDFTITHDFAVTFDLTVTHEFAAVCMWQCSYAAVQTFASKHQLGFRSLRVIDCIHVPNISLDYVCSTGLYLSLSSRPYARSSVTLYAFPSPSWHVRGTSCSAFERAVGL